MNKKNIRMFFLFMRMFISNQPNVNFKHFYTCFIKHQKTTTSKN